MPVPTCGAQMGDAALHVGASAHGTAEALRTLVTRCGANIELKNATGKTALHLAAANNNIEVAKLLVDIGCADLWVKDKACAVIVALL